MSTTDMQRYKIVRRGKEATKLIVAFPDGRKKLLQASGPHVWTLSPADLQIVQALPCVHIVPIDEPAPPAAKKPDKGGKASEVVEKAEAKKAKKKGAKKG